MKRNRVHLLAVAAVALSVGLAIAAIAAGSSGKTTPSAARSAAAPQKVKLPMKTIGIMGPVDAAEIIKLGTDASDMAAKALGWKTIRVDPQGDPAKMASGMNSLVNSNVDAIVLTIIEPATIQAGLRAAQRKGIPVINTLVLAHASPLIAGGYWPSSAAEVALMTARMKRELPRGSKLGLIQLPQFLNAAVVATLFKASAKQNGWEVVATHDSDVQNLIPDVKKAVGDMIRANPDIDAIWGCCDFSTAAGVPAIRASGKDVKLYALHGVPSSIQFVKTGIAVVQISDYQKGSFIAMDQLASHFANGTKIAKKTPKAFAFKQAIADRASAAKGYPYPTSRMLAQFKARWGKLYIKAG